MLSPEQAKWVSSLTVAKLKDELKNRGLPAGGLKAELAARLSEALEKGEASPDRPEPAADPTPDPQQSADDPAPKAASAAASPAPAVQAVVSPKHAKEDSPKHAKEDAVPEPVPSPKHAKEDAVPEPVPSPKHEKKDVAPQAARSPRHAQEDVAPQAAPSPKHAQRDVAPSQPAPPQPEAVSAMHVDEAEVEEVDYGLDEPAIQQPADEQPEEAPPEPAAPPTAAQQTAKAGKAPEQAAVPKEPEPQSVQTQPSLETVGSGLDEDKGRKRRAPIQFAPKAKQQPATPTAAAAAPTPAPAEPATATDTPAADNPPPSRESLRVALPTAPSLERRVTAPSPLAQAPSTMPPPVGLPSCAMRIDNLVRPFMESGLRALITKNGAIKDFWMPSIKTHAFVIMETDAEGEATCAALHGLAWPQNSPKRLTITYLTAEEAQQGIAVGRQPAQLPSPRVSAGAPTPTAAAGPGAKPKVGMGAVAAVKAAISAASGSALQKGIINSIKRPRSSSPNDEAQPAAAGGEAGDEPTAKRTRTSTDQGEEGDGAGAGKDQEGDEVMEAAGEDEPAPISLDTLFKKTVSKPPLYWLPLTDEQIEEKKVKEAKEEAAAALVPPTIPMTRDPASLAHRDDHMRNGGGRGYGFGGR